MDCELVRNGTLHCAVGRSGLAEVEERAQQWGERGAPVNALSRAETAARIGADFYAGSLLDRRAGTIQPLAYARGPRRGGDKGRRHDPLAKPGARGRADGQALAARDRPGKRRCRLDRGRDDAYGGAPWPQGRREQIWMPYFNFATRPLSAELQASILPGREGCWDTRLIMNSFRFDQGGRFLFGSIGALRGTGLAVHRAWAARAVKKTFPQIGAIDFETQWYGMIGMTGNALPRFHRLAPNVVSFCGYNGAGHRNGDGVRPRACRSHSGQVERKGFAAAGQRAGRAGAAGASRGLL